MADDKLKVKVKAKGRKAEELLQALQPLSNDQKARQAADRLESKVR